MRAFSGPVLMVLFGILVGGLPVIVFPYFPTTDGPAHLNTAIAVAKLAGVPGVVDGVIQPRSISLASQAASAAMAGMVRLGAGVWAEKAAWLGIIVAFAAIVTAGLAMLARRALAFAPFFFAILAGNLTHVGLMNFMAGLALMLLTALWVERGTRQPSAVWVAGLLGTAALTYFAHPLAGLGLGAALGGYAVSGLALHRLAGCSPAGWQLRVTAAPVLVPMACLLACGVLLTLAAIDALPQIVRFLSKTAAGVSGAGMAGTVTIGGDGLIDRVVKLVTFSYFVSYAAADFAISAVFALLFAGLCVWRARRLVHDRALGPSDGWLIASLVIVAIAVLSPRSFESVLPKRMNACLLITALLWFATFPLTPRAARALLGFGLVLNVGIAAWRLTWTERINHALAEYASIAPALAGQSTVISITNKAYENQQNCFRSGPRRLPCRFQPSLHFLGRVVGERDLVWVSNYQLRPQSGFFPIELAGEWARYVPYIDLFDHWALPPAPDAAAALLDEVRTLLARQPVDAVVVWDDLAIEGAADPVFAAGIERLLVGYRKVFVSSPAQAATVYTRDTTP